MAQELLHATLENEIRALADELRGKQTAEMTPGAAQEIIKNALGERMKRVDIGGPTGGPAPVVSTPSTSGQSSAILPAYANDLPREQKLRVEQLVEIALHQGLAAAVTSAKKSDPIILDVLHDALAGRLYGLMKERGVI